MNFEALPNTEGINPRTRGLDTLATASLVDVLITEQSRAIDAVRERKSEIAQVVDVIVERLRAGGRLHYVGSGSSGRLGFLDAAECPPTFGTPPDLVCGHIAGGPPAMMRAIEGAEDNGDAGAEEMREHVGPHDVVVGISASGSAAYVIAALVASHANGAHTVAITNSAQTKLASVADNCLFLDTGPEVIAGSTRMKAGTAQKVLLNTISSAVMVRLGKVYDNLMVDVVATNKKLRARANRLVMQLAEVDEATAQSLLEQAGGRVKIAVIMAQCGLDAPAASARLSSAAGSLRASLSTP